MTKVKTLAAAQTIRTWSQRRGPEGALCVGGEGGACWAVEDSAAGDVTPPPYGLDPAVRTSGERVA